MSSGSLFVGGIVSLSMTDYPGHLSTVIFMQGCLWRCVYCHNRHLQSVMQDESLPWEDILYLLKTREGLVEAVVFSGGEPLLQESLPSAIADVRRMGFKVGLHTSGAFPDRLAKILHSLDWVGFDVKHRFENYREITNVGNSGFLACESLKLLISSGTDFEVRITLYEKIETSAVADILKNISALGVRTVALQKCRDRNENVVEHPIFSDKLLLEDMSKYFENFYIR
jgi:pyruvate formate lyase activating enzyme